MIQNAKGTGSKANPSPVRANISIAAFKQTENPERHYQSYLHRQQHEKPKPFKFRTTLEQVIWMAMRVVSITGVTEGTVHSIMGTIISVLDITVDWVLTLVVLVQQRKSFIPFWQVGQRDTAGPHPPYTHTSQSCEFKPWPLVLAPMWTWAKFSSLLALHSNL